MNEPLKPCPFCNTTPILQHTRETGYYIHCPGCGSYTHGIEWSREEALAVWNNRPSPWVRIDPERPETLPPHNKKRWLARRHEDGRTQTIEGERIENGFNDETPAYHAWFGYLEHYEIYAHSVIVIPEPPPYLGDETP